MKHNYGKMGEWLKPSASWRINCHRRLKFIFLLERWVSGLTIRQLADKLPQKIEVYIFIGEMGEWLKPSASWRINCHRRLKFIFLLERWVSGLTIRQLADQLPQKIEVYIFIGEMGEWLKPSASWRINCHRRLKFIFLLERWVSGLNHPPVGGWF